jgi:hypothetical protein
MANAASLDDAEQDAQDNAREPVTIIASSDDDDFQANMFTLANGVLAKNIDAKDAMAVGALLGMAHKNRRKPKDEKRTLTIIDSDPKGIGTNAAFEDAELLPTPVPVSYRD